MFGIVRCFLVINLLLLVGIQCKDLIKRAALDSDDGKSSLAFVFDTTGSMYNDLKQLREGAEMILNTALKESDVIADFVFVPFHDPAVGPVTVTRRKEVFKRALSMVRVHGGGDCPEKSLTGIHLALNVSRPRSFLYVFTDATAGDHRIVGKVLDTIQRKQSQVVFILTGHCNDLKRPSYKVYQQVAAASSGQIFNLNKTSVHKMLDFVTSSIKGRMVNLASVSNPPGYNYTQEIPVDSTLGEVTVSVSGAKPKITVVDPNGEQLTGPPKLITTLDLSEIMVVKVMQPEPGNWTITVGSEEEHSVKVVGLSNVTFTHGFSVEQPASMKETSYRPLRGTYNHMLISLSPPNASAAIGFAEILTLDGRVLFELPLKRVDNNVYKADPFIPPDEFFYIAINGQDQHKQDLRRVGTTAVQAQSPDVPYLTTPRKVEARSHTRVVLPCNVESLVPVTAMWTKDASRVDKQISSLQSTSLEYVIENMKEEDVGTYRCIAHNVAGVSKAVTLLTLIVEPPQITIHPENASVELGDTITISCTVEARSHTRVVLPCNVESLVPVTAMWTKDASRVDKQISSLQSTSLEYVIENMKEEDVGTYRCIAHNVAGVSKAVTLLTLIVEPPQITIHPENASVELGDTITISCTVYSEALLLENRLIFNGTQTNYAIDVDKNPNIEGVYSYNKTLRLTEKDIGLYSCVAANRGGKANQSTHISLRVNPTAQILGPHTLSKLINSEFQLVCTVDNAATLVWTAPNGTVMTSRDVTGAATEVLNVKNVTDDGGFTCTAVRGSRKGSDTVNVTVLIKPVVSIIGSKNITILNGTIIEVTCQVIAKPAPRILWHRETETFLNNTITQIKPNMYRSVLMLNSSAESINATYFCFGENSEGIHQDSVTVNVRRKMALLHGFSDQSVQLYYQVELQCNVDSHPPPQITWYHNGTELSTGTNVHMSEDNTTVYLKRIDFTDLGLYVCEADNGFEKINVNGSISVVGLASPVLSKDPVSVTSHVGRPTIITCRIIDGNPEPTITWQYRRPSSENFTALPKDIINNEKELIISNTTEDRVGLYRCVAANVIGKDEYDVSLVVQYPPRFSKSTTEDKPRQIRVGERVSFSCEADGLPPPITVWTKDMHPIVFTDNVLLSNTNELVIQKASAYDSGTYTCNVTSAVGSTQKNFTLVVYDPPSISPSSSDPIQEVLEGQAVELPCSAQGVPAPIVQWTLNGQALSTRRMYVDENGLRFVANLTDFGEYTCTATNIHGNISVTYMLHVWVPPYISPPLQVTKEALLGSNVTLQCDVIGFPLPTVRWLFEGNALTDNTTDLSFNDVGNVYILNASAKHEGLYICVAENNGGVAEQTTFLKVNEPPSILEDNYTGPYIATDMDTVLTLACPATGKPKPFVVWSKDEFYLNNDPRYAIDTDGTLSIKSPSEDMSGNYTCTVSNSVGNTSKTMPVEIYSIPTHMQSEESLSSVTVLEGSDVTLQCPLRATHTLKWYKHLRCKERKTPFNRSSSPNNVSRTNSSTYSCVVSNAVGSAHSKVHVKVEWPPTFVGNATKSLEVVRGEDTYLDCAVDAKPKAKTKWVFNSKTLVFEDKDHLKLINTQPHSAGAYKCIVSNIHGTVIKEFSLNVLEPPFISDFDLLDVQLKEGMNATLECNAKGTPAPSLTWTYNNTNWHQHNSSLSSSNITSQSEGIYRCDATNKAGATHIVYRVSIVAAPKVEDIVAFRNGQGVSVDGKLEIVQGSRIRIACKASGNPIPDIQWIKQGAVVGENSYDIDYADLVLNNVQVRQGGVYTCVANNEGGVNEKTVKIDVLEPPKIFQTLFQNANTTSNEVHLEVISGQSFYLHCHPYGNPLPEVYWFKDDVPLKLFDDAMVSTDFGEVIVVKKAMESQSGNYTCVARNKVGNTSVVYLVDVLVPPPLPKESSKKVTAGFGKPLVLTCPAVGSPVPEIMWIKHPYTEISGDTRMVLSEDNFDLIINQTEVTDSGKYSCIMMNKVGTTEVVFDVTVQKPPSIAANVGSNLIEGHVVALKRSIVLKCEADGYPLPKITWLKDTQALSESLSNIQRVLGNSLLAIWSADVKDAGQYICVVENEAGTAHRRYNVAIQVPAKWSPWSQWSLCNTTCGLGYQERSRSCYYIDDNNNTIDSSSKSEKIILDQSACKGPTVDKRKCHMPPCDVEESKPRWSVWSKWSECSATCGVGTQARTRRCKTKARCDGDNVQIKKCDGLPLCSPTSSAADTDVFDSKEDIGDSDNYLPDQTFEMQPEVINSHFSPDVEGFYSTSGSQSTTVFYDVSVSDNLDHSDRGPCDAGYRHNKTANTCDDVDECVFETNQCHSTQLCLNTDGGYRCSCPPGYLSLAAGQRCMDINECQLETDGCSHSCVNTAGGYVCACPRHLRLHLDKHHCVTPALYRRPLSELESDYLSTTIEFPKRYTIRRSIN
uniref:Hemolin n=2 Tax=Heliothis virescens TaxID=7102 RepID=A0A2A4JKA5_HELVI